MGPAGGKLWGGLGVAEPGARLPRAVRDGRVAVRGVVGAVGVCDVICDVPRLS